ncbi:ABC transporter permease [Gulosibacter sediminis]|uniref:ABC transporter permease n=1 Tax=Gulosibacter sediminis TaxID=1729695 RepID=UPI0024ADA742|nr:ABC transporter permease [Gulosibacter sediminis]
MIGAFELGLIYAVVALGVYLTFRILNFPDLTVDGSFTTGAAVAAVCLSYDMNPVLAILLSFAAGAIAGAITGVLHTYGKIDGLLAGILTMIALWSVNLRIMGISNGTAALSNVGIRSSESAFSGLREAGLLGTWGAVGILFVAVFVLKLVIDWFLSTDLGLSIQATGNNEQMIRSFGVNTDAMKILTLALSNGLVAVGGALVAQYTGSADISMGVGLILIGLASVILGQAFFGNRWVWLASFGVIVGAVLYRLVIFAALSAGLSNTDVRLITAVIVVIALLIPRFGIGKRLGLDRLMRGKQTEPAAAPATTEAEPAAVPAKEAQQ